ncbi:MAG: hypothetical protein HQ551_01575 [Desulfobacteraceae bacterium]|nr:hypothetical protein [Desulfobacteraceae bacterium]
MFRDQENIETILSALGEQLESSEGEPLDLLVCGGSALIALGLAQRTTKDVDILALVKRKKTGKTTLNKAEPLSDGFITASKKVARDFNLPENWINTGPTSAVDLGLPNGIMERVTTRAYGPKLTIHFKLYAAADQGAGKHFDDILALNPTEDELEQAALWSMTHDVSEGYRQVLKGLLNHMGFKNVAENI